MIEIFNETDDDGDNDDNCVLEDYDPNVDFSYFVVSIGFLN